MSTLNEFSITEKDLNNSSEVEVSVKANIESDLEIVLQGIKMLVESIDPKFMCEEDRNLHSNSMEQILFAVADNIGFQNDWYFINPNIEKSKDQYGEYTISDKSKYDVLKDFIEMRK